MNRDWLPVLLGWGMIGCLLGSARVALACSVCFSADEATRQAYYGTTAFMILLPLALFGWIGVWLYRASRKVRDPLPERIAAIKAKPAE